MSAAPLCPTCGQPASKALGGPEQHAVDTSSLAQQRADRVGQLNFSAGARRRALQRGEDPRRQNVSRRNGERAGSIGGTRFFNEIRQLDQAAGPAVARQHDAVRRRVFTPDLFEGDDGGSAGLVEGVGHPPHDVALPLEPDD